MYESNNDKKLEKARSGAMANQVKRNKKMKKAEMRPKC